MPLRMTSPGACVLVAYGTTGSRCLGQSPAFHLFGPSQNGRQRDGRTKDQAQKNNQSNTDTDS